MLLKKKIFEQQRRLGRRLGVAGCSELRKPAREKLRVFPGGHQGINSLRPASLHTTRFRWWVAAGDAGELRAVQSTPAYRSAFLPQGTGRAHLLSSFPHTERGCVFTLFSGYKCGLSLQWTGAQGTGRVHSSNRRGCKTCSKSQEETTGSCYSASVCEARLAGLHTCPRANESTRDPVALGCPTPAVPDVHSTSRRPCAPGRPAGPAPHVRALNQPAAAAAPHARAHGGALLSAPRTHAAPLSRRDPALATRRLLPESPRTGSPRRSRQLRETWPREKARGEWLQRAARERARAPSRAPSADSRPEPSPAAARRPLRRA